MISITLYEPADPPAIPRKKIGKANLSTESWERIGGVGRYYDHGGMKTFALTLWPERKVADFDPEAIVSETEVIHRIVCEAVIVYVTGNRSWSAVVMSEEDRNKVMELKGTWEG